ncbi:MAG TPA: nucleotide disphospho-sugar-binding domain-containing protein [Solirubrobacterales bacterium]|jgi:MGT family glycosyltransferase|nr:nucleotide disphospho-sugar-binding domain-containing protein [Solirubrobacterales bacterium]
MAAGRRLRLLLVAIGEPGHAFPMIAIGKELVARGHEVAIHTWVRWREHIEAESIQFIQAPKFDHGPEENAPTVHEAAALAANELAARIREYEPDVIVSDVLTLSGSLASELCDIPLITFVPHFWHVTEDDAPPFGSGWSPPRTALGRRFFRSISPFERYAVEFGRGEMNQSRAEVGLPPTERLHGGLSTELILVGTLPQLEPPRTLPDHVKVVGPVQWEPPSEPPEFPSGDRPLIAVAPSTAQDLDHRVLGASVAGLRDLPVRVLASKNGREPARALKPGDNTMVVDWLSYSQSFPQADVVITHGGHGTIMRALTSGAAVVICPASGDQFENAARLRWAGVGVAVSQRFISSRTIAAAVEKVISRPEMTARARELAAWAAANDGAVHAADEIEAHMQAGTTR